MDLRETDRGWKEEGYEGPCSHLGLLVIKVLNIGLQLPLQPFEIENTYLGLYTIQPLQPAIAPFQLSYQLFQSLAAKTFSWIFKTLLGIVLEQRWGRKNKSQWQWMSQLSRNRGPQLYFWIERVLFNGHDFQFAKKERSIF